MVRNAKKIYIWLSQITKSNSISNMSFRKDLKLKLLHACMGALLVNAF
jgi:hypothetical protein